MASALITLRASSPTPSTSWPFAPTLPRLSAVAGAQAGCTGFGGGAGLHQGLNDGYVENNANDISFGWNAGLFYEPTDRTRLGVAYRSQINHKLDGDAEFTVPATIHAAGALDAGIRSLFRNTGIEAGVSLPESASFSIYQRVHEKLALLGDITWTGWASIQELRFVFDAAATGGTGTSVEDLRWENTLSYALGLNYYHSDRLTLRLGGAYDESPIPNPETRTARLPDNDRLWLGAGASYRWTKRLSADIAFAHLFIGRHTHPAHRKHGRRAAW